MRNVCVLGGGKIGSLIATLLVECGDYVVTLGDVDQDVVTRLKNDIVHDQLHVGIVDVQNRLALRQFLEAAKPEGIISSLPYYCNPLVGELARSCGAHYFDLTEDVEVTRKIRDLSQGGIGVRLPAGHQAYSGPWRAGFDSHKRLPIVDASLDELAACDFLPFVACASAPLAMTAHVAYRAIDGPSGFCGRCRAEKPSAGAVWSETSWPRSA